MLFFEVVTFFITQLFTVGQTAPKVNGHLPRAIWPFDWFPMTNQEWIRVMVVPDDVQ